MSAQRLALRASLISGFYRILCISVLVGAAPGAVAYAASGDPEPVITAYVFPRDTLLTAHQIDVKKLTRINFAFANIEDGRIVEGSSSDAKNLETLNEARKVNQHLTILVSVGGWLWSGHFSDVALTSASRATFIESVSTFITDHHLDGMDIDWEYPGTIGAGNIFRPEDKQNYTLLLHDLRVSFDHLELHLHRRLYLTIAAGASEEFLKHTEMSEVQKYVDTINLMSYDYYEPGDEAMTGNHSPLFVDPADPKAVSSDKSVQEYIDAGVPRSKIVLGIPFYGHAWGEVPATSNGLFQPGKQVPGLYADYHAITTTMLTHGFTRYWDQASCVPYLYSPDRRIFVSYEDPESIAFKAHYVRDHHLAGIMFWEYTRDPSGILLNAVYSGLHTHTDINKERRH